MGESVIGWIAQHTGLPSLLIDGPGVVYAGDRVLTVATGGMVVSDPFAPLGKPITYRHESASVTLTRPDLGIDLITSADGHSQVPIHLLGRDETDLDTGMTVFTAGGGFGIPSWPLHGLPERGAIECRTAGPDTLILKGLLAGHGPMVKLHSPQACHVPDCDVPPVLVFLASKAKHARDGVITQARRIWQIPYTAHRVAQAASPVVTWEEYARASNGWTDESYHLLCSRIAGMPRKGTG